MNHISIAIARAGLADDGLSSKISRLLRNPTFLASRVFNHLAPAACRQRVTIVAAFASGVEISTRVIPVRIIDDALRWYDHAIHSTLDYVLQEKAREHA